MLTLILKEGSDEAKTLHVSQDVVTLGRSKENIIILRNIKASRHHAKIERIGGTYQISDLGSGNGTRVNGQKIDFQALNTGDEIKIGDATVTLKSIDDAVEGDDVSEEPTEQIQLEGDEDLKLQGEEAVEGEAINLDDDNDLKIEDDQSDVPNDERETEIAIKPTAPAKPAGKPLQRPGLSKPAPKPAAPPAKAADPKSGPAKKPSLADRFKKKP
jgi:pSer/pThr/pTyr-binding forkhead associated (FHA) protein